MSKLTAGFVLLLLSHNIMFAVRPALANLAAVAPPNLSYLSTEKFHPITAALSQTMHKDCVQGLTLLHQVDTQVIAGLQEFSNHYFDNLTKLVNGICANNGRCFLIGSGSSGRIAVDIAARCSKDTPVVGLIAGGDSAFIRAREGFEDSESAGTALIEAHGVTSRDLVMLISASGSAAFNIGCAKQARKVGATVCYFYNSTQVPLKTQNLFEKQGVIPIVIDIGPQAITGSTRLQAATLARLALGTLFTGQSLSKQLAGLAFINTKIAARLPDIARIIKLEHVVFAHPQSNFRKLKDETAQGYVTFIGDKTVFRDIVMDTVETAPTFSTNPPRVLQEAGKKRAEFQAYLVGVKDAVEAWQDLVGRPVNPNDLENCLKFSVTEDALAWRPLGQHNVLIGVAWENPQALAASFALARTQGAKTALILLSEHKISDETVPECDAVLILDDLPHDATGLLGAVALKQVLNMVSNGTMILMNKVDGNQMIDTNASNNKLIDRAVRLTESILTKYWCIAKYDYEAIALCMQTVLNRKKQYEEKNIYTPSPVKIAFTMLYKTIDFEAAVALLCDYQENLERVCA